MGRMGETGSPHRDMGRDRGTRDGDKGVGEWGHEDVWAGEMAVPELEGRGHEGMGRGHGVGEAREDKVQSLGTCGDKGGGVGMGTRLETQEQGGGDWSDASAGTHMPVSCRP